MSKRSDEITALRKVRIESGICRDCGNLPLIENKVVCVSCSAKRLHYSKSFKSGLIEKGLCARCACPNERKGQFLCVRCAENQIQAMRLKRKENKIFIVNHFGGKCKECGETDIRCLGLDHVNNDGKIDKLSDKGTKQATSAWYTKLVKLIKTDKDLPRELQLLCFNCHAKKDLKPWWFDDNI